MKKARFTAVAAALVVMAVMVQPAMAAQNAGNWDNFYNSLTPEKQKAATQIIEDNSKQMFELRQKIWAKHVELQAAMKADNPDKAAVKALTSEIIALRDQMYTAQKDFHANLEKETGYDFTNSGCIGTNCPSYTNCGFKGAKAGCGYKGKKDCTGACPSAGASGCSRS